MSTKMFFEATGTDRSSGGKSVSVEMGYHDEQGKSFFYIMMGDSHVVLSEMDSTSLLEAIEQNKHRIK